MSSRRLALTPKKLRGVSRRLRALSAWAAQFEGTFPPGLTEADRYRNYKIPVHQALLEGPQSTPELRRECAQRLIDACWNLMQSKPPEQVASHVVATIGLPDMFSSEVCIYSDADYFRSKLEPASHPFGSSTRITGRSLAAHWGLLLPEGMRELGMLVDYRGTANRDDWYVSEHWFFGELP